MVALLDPDALDGQSSAPPGSSFACTSCGPAAPLRYVVLPRSEVNRASASPFNRALLTAKADSLLVRTIEMTVSGGGPADALYEFMPSLELTRASYSDRYWELHRQLEAQGKITHTREQCPDRDGPREIRVWKPQIAGRRCLSHGDARGLLSKKQRPSGQFDPSSDRAPPSPDRMNAAQ
jgi:hypothetical protein